MENFLIKLLKALECLSFVKSDDDIYYCNNDWLNCNLIILNECQLCELYNFIIDNDINCYIYVDGKRLYIEQNKKEV